VDRAVLAFLRSEALHPADFTIREDGVVRHNPELAKRVASRSNSSNVAGISSYTNLVIERLMLQFFGV